MTPIDMYIANASERTQPILDYLRKLIHSACPEIDENIKWNCPSFELGGNIVCTVMAFKKHVNFMFHQGKELTDGNGLLQNIGEKSKMKGVKQITKISDLPDEKKLVLFIKEAVEISKR